MVNHLLQWGRPRFSPWVGISWRRKWQPTPVFLPGKSPGQKSLEGYSLWGHKESDMTEQLHYNRNSTQWRVQRSNLYFSLDAANTTADYRRSINSSNCHISFSSKETEISGPCAPQDGCEPQTRARSVNVVWNPPWARAKKRSLIFSRYFTLSIM